MKAIVGILFFPLSVFIEAIVGVVYPVESTSMRRPRRWALVSLAGVSVALGLAMLLAMVAPWSPAIGVLLVIGAILSLGFCMAGKACAGEGEGTHERRRA